MRAAAEQALVADHPAGPTLVGGIVGTKGVDAPDLVPVLGTRKPLEHHRSPLALGGEVELEMTARGNNPLERLLAADAFDERRRIEVESPHWRVERVATEVAENPDTEVVKGAPLLGVIIV